VIAHSLGNMVVGSAIQDFGMAFDMYMMLNPAVALETYEGAEENPVEMRHPSWDEFYFGDDYNDGADTETYDQNDAAGVNGRRLWSTEWHTLFPATDARRNLTWRNRFYAVGDSANVIQYYSSGEEVLRQDEPGPPASLEVAMGYLPGNDTPTGGYNAWNIQEKSKGRDNLAAFLAAGSSAGWGFNDHCGTDDSEASGGEICWVNGKGLLSHTEAQVFFDAPNETLIQEPFFDPFDPVEDMDLHDLNNGDAVVDITFPRTMGYEIPALSFSAGGTKIAHFRKAQAYDMNNEMADGWPASRGGVNGKAWWHSDYKNVSYRYTYKLFDSIVDEGALR